MRPKIILHVGTEKTGTTSIQSIFKITRDSLLKKHVLFPSSLGQLQHLRLTACALEDNFHQPILRLLNIKNKHQFDEFKGQVIKSLSQEISNTSPNTILISDEHINSHLPSIELLQNYKKLCLKFGDVQSVIIYLRRQDLFLLSMFSEAVKVGSLIPENITAPLPPLPEIPYKLNYLRILDNLSSVFGEEKMVVRVFDRKRFIGNNLIKDFASYSGIGIDLTEDQGLTKNKSIDGRVIYHLAKLSCLLKKFDGRNARSIRRRCVKRCTDLFDGPGPVMSHKVHATFLAQFHEQNEIIKKKYLKDLPADQPLFPAHQPAGASEPNSYPQYTMPAFTFWRKMILGR